MFRKSFQLLVLICLIFGLVKSCTLNVRNPYPLFFKNFGSKNITFRPTESGIKLDKGESIQVFCGTGLDFDFNGYYGYYSDLKGQHQTGSVVCNEDDYILIKGIDENKRERQLYITCSSSSSSGLYESERKLPNCDNFPSYVVGEQIPFMGTIKRLAMCYDIDNFALKYVNYIAYDKKDILITPEHTLSGELKVDLGQKVDNLQNYFPFMSQRWFNDSRDRNNNDFFNAFEYDLDSIIQDEPMSNKFDTWTYLLNTMWWRQLRQNNWRFFLDALRERTNSQKYRVFVGTYGNATLPITKSSDSQPEVVKVKTAELVVTAPMYIWAYIKSLAYDNDEEFVVIAHNSPYVKTPNHADFCESDICDEISWLKDNRFGHLRRISTFGYTFCCRADEVAKVIDYFPMSKQMIETSTAAATPKLVE